MALPRPGTSTIFPWKWKYSATMLAFQAPPEAVTMPVTRYGKIPGKIRLRQRSNRRNRKTSAASFRSVGIAIAPAITLKRMYHCVPSSISAMAASSTPPRKRINTSRSTGNNAVAGIDAANCTSGCISRAKRGLKPMATPTGTVQSAPIISASDAQERESRAAQQSQKVGTIDLGELPDGAINAINHEHRTHRGQKPTEPARFCRLRGGESGGGAFCSARKLQGEPVDDGM